jgi:hypothetical protein
MRLQRLVVGLLGSALLGVVPVALTATPAEAASVSTRVTFVKQARSVYKYDTRIKIAGAVQGYGSGGWGYLPDTSTGVIKLQRRMAGTTKWKTIATDSDDGLFSFVTRSRGVARYRVSYNGAAYGSDTFRPTRKDRVIKGSRHTHSKGVKRGGRLYYRGNVDPGWGHRPVSIQKKNCRSCGWHGYKTVRTSRTGGYSARIAAPASGRWFYRAVVKATRPRFVKATGATIYTYRARTPRSGAAGIGG